MTDPKPTLAELELREQLYNAMDGNLRMSHRRKLLNAYRDAILASVLPPAEGPEYTPCVACGHIEPEHRPDAGPCLMCGCTAYRPGRPESADRADLRQHIAEVIYEFRYGRAPQGESWDTAREDYCRMAARILAVLSEPVDRAVVRAEALRDAAAAIEAEQAREEATAWAESDEPDPEIEVEGAVVRARAALLRRMADETSATTPQPETCAHCGKTILRITGTLTAWWVHDPGGHTICDPQQAATSTRATPKPAAGARQDGAQT